MTKSKPCLPTGKIKVGIFFGGDSSEKEVSLEGGRNVFLKMDEERYEKLPIFVDNDYKFWLIDEKLIIQNTTSDLTKLVTSSAKLIKYEDLKNTINFAFIVGHGKYMEDGCLQGLLELQKIPYNGPGILGSALGANKLISRLMLKSNGIDVPKTLSLGFNDWQNDQKTIIELINKEFSYPIVVKPSREGCSTAITKVKSESELDNAFKSAFKWDKIILVEEFLSGKELTVSVLGNRDQQALPVTETPRSGAKDYLTLEDKFLPGGAEMITPAKISNDDTKKAQGTAVKVCKTLDLIGYPRIDMFLTDDNRLVVLEANTLPGITPSTMIFHQAAEIDLSPTDYISRIIELGLEAHKGKKGPL
ncbi:MAG: hypothetical protein ACD_58C00306G0010 [uncultured bacterium]|nr:MAG: hypothetical protein ACD_58C00306G0010 [uncultured bacterium]